MMKGKYTTIFQAMMPGKMNNKIKKYIKKQHKKYLIMNKMLRTKKNNEIKKSGLKVSVLRLLSYRCKEPQKTLSAPRNI